MRLKLSGRLKTGDHNLLDAACGISEDCLSLVNKGNQRGGDAPAIFYAVGVVEVIAICITKAAAFVFIELFLNGFQIIGLRFDEISLLHQRRYLLVKLCDTMADIFALL